jgi:hypothetical protein
MDAICTRSRPLSSALARFDVNGATGRLTYRGAQRSSGAGLAAMAGARDLVATPGDTHLYALGSSGVVGFVRAQDGSVAALPDAVSTIAGTVDARALSLDAFGARLYVADATGKVHVYARNWGSGALDYRVGFTASGGQLAAPNELLHVPASEDLYVSSSTPGRAGAAGRTGDVSVPERGRDPERDLGPISTSASMDGPASASPRPCTRVPAAPCRNTAAVQVGQGTDPVATNNSATDQTLIRVVSDLVVTKTGPAQIVAGTDIQYQVQVRNNGPQRRARHPGQRHAARTARERGVDVQQQRRVAVSGQRHRQRRVHDQPVVRRSVHDRHHRARQSPRLSA